MLPLSRSQIERLGERLVKPAPAPDESDLALLRELLVAYREVLDVAVGRIAAPLGVSPTSRIKNRGTILEKLETNPQRHPPRVAARRGAGSSGTSSDVDRRCDRRLRVDA